MFRLPSRSISGSTGALVLIAALVVLSLHVRGEDADPAVQDPAVARARNIVQMLDNIYKQTIVLITDKYVHDDDDFAAGSAAVLLFKNISEGGSHEVRLLDATGLPHETTNVARDEFEKEGIRQLKQGAESFERVVNDGDHRVLRVLTPVPVVMQKCVMCHEHYADVKPGEPIGAISYQYPID